MSAQLQRNYTIEEYFRLEQDSEEKLEFWNGNVWTMSGASIAHNRIVRNIVRRLDERLQTRGCEVFPSDARIYVPKYPPYRYPDASALCGKVEVTKIGGLEMLMNPQLIIEVLSDSTEAFDRGDKFNYYKSIPSFSEYLLVSQKRAQVSQFIKQSENAWTNIEYAGLETALELQFAECSLSLSEIYRDVTFETELLLKIVGRNNEPTDAF